MCSILEMICVLIGKMATLPQAEMLRGGAVDCEPFPNLPPSTWSDSAAMSPPQQQQRSVAELLEHLHLESSQPPDERFAWLHRHSQHTQHPLVQFEFSKTHLTLRIVPKRLRRTGDRGRKSASHEKAPSTGSSSSSSEEGRSQGTRSS